MVKKRELSKDLQILAKARTKERKTGKFGKMVDLTIDRMVLKNMSKKRNGD